MITNPYPEITIDAPMWMRRIYQESTGKTIDERYKEKVDELLVKIIKELWILDKTDNGN